MAERVVNSGIEFAYTSEHIEVELKLELEKYFLYQTIIVVDKFFEFGETIKKLEQNVKCNFVVTHDINEIDSFENISCLIIVNNHDIDDIKLLCYKQNIPYIIAMTDLANSMCFKNYAYGQCKIVQCNFPLGIVLSQSSITNHSYFVSRAILEIGSLSFDILQKKLNNLFFGENIEYKEFAGQKKLLIELQTVLGERREDIKALSKRIATLYLSYGLISSKDKPSLLDNLIYLYSLNNKNRYLIEIKYAFSLIVTSLEKNYFIYYTHGFKSYIDYEKHQEYLTSTNLKSNFVTHALPDEKLNFLLDEFREKLLEYVKSQIAFEKLVKNMIAEIDIDFLYKTFVAIKDKALTNYLSLEPDIFTTPNFLSILYKQGLLNFNF